MQKHCSFEHFFKFLNQIGPKGTLIVTLQAGKGHSDLVVTQEVLSSLVRHGSTVSEH